MGNKAALCNMFIVKIHTAALVKPHYLTFINRLTTSLAFVLVREKSVVVPHDSHS